MFQVLLDNLDWIVPAIAIAGFFLFVRAARGSGQQKVIMMACQWGDDKAVRDFLAEASWLAKAVDANGFTPLHVAAMWGHDDIVQMLLKHKAEVNARNRAGMTPLHGAAMAGHDDIVRDLLAAGADPKARDGLGNTPLYFAVFDGHAECVKALIRSGADVNAETNQGESLLERAEARGHIDVAQLLIDCGAHRKDGSGPSGRVRPTHPKTE